LPLQFTEGLNPSTNMAQLNLNGYKGHHGLTDPERAAKYNEMKDTIKKINIIVNKIKDNYKGTRVTANRHLAQLENIARRYKNNRDEAWRFWERYGVMMEYLYKEKVIK